MQFWIQKNCAFRYFDSKFVHTHTQRGRESVSSVCLFLAKLTRNLDSADSAACAPLASLSLSLSVCVCPACCVGVCVCENGVRNGNAFMQLDGEYVARERKRAREREGGRKEAAPGCLSCFFFLFFLLSSHLFCLANCKLVLL